MHGWLRVCWKPERRSSARNTRRKSTARLWHQNGPTGAGVWRAECRWKRLACRRNCQLFLSEWFSLGSPRLFWQQALSRTRRSRSPILGLELHPAWSSVPAYNNLLLRSPVRLAASRGLPYFVGPLLRTTTGGWRHSVARSHTLGRVVAQVAN